MYHFLYKDINHESDDYFKELEQKREEYNQKKAAVRSAYDRYKKHSAFYRLLHKSVYKMDPYNSMTVDEINDLYEGKSK